MRVDERRLLTIAEAADYLRCSAETVRRRIHSGDVPTLRLGSIIRIDEQQLRQAMSEGSRDG